MNVTTKITRELAERLLSGERPASAALQIELITPRRFWGAPCFRVSVVDDSGAVLAVIHEGEIDYGQRIYITNIVKAFEVNVN